MRVGGKKFEEGMGMFPGGPFWKDVFHVKKEAKTRQAEEE